MTSAQVVLKASSLLRAGAAGEQFKAAGFQVGAVVGISFPISGPADLFERFFQVRAEAAGDRPFVTDELPISGLNPTLRADIQAVLVTRRPDFGAGGHY